MRRRSSLLTLFLASAALTPLLSACEKKPVPPAPAVYASQSQCVADGNTPALCAQAFSAARSSADTPRFTDKARCEAEFGSGHCETSSGGSGFSPMLTGFMLGQMMNGGGGTTVIHHYTPVYQTVGGGYYSGARPMSSPPVVYGSSAWSSTRSAPAYAGSTSRGGFGASAAGHGGGGGGGGGS